MTFIEAKKEFYEQLMESQGCLTRPEVIAKLGKTTIRCCWVDFTDSLNRDHRITDKQRMNWGQVI